MASFESLVSIHETFDSKDQECIIGDIGITIKITAFRTHAHGVDSEAHLLERLLGIEVFPLLVVGHEFFLAQLIEVFHNGIVRRLHLTVVGGVGNTEPCIQFRKQNFNGVDLCIGKILIAAEEVL